MKDRAQVQIAIADAEGIFSLALESGVGFIQVSAQALALEFDHAASFWRRALERQRMYCSPDRLDNIIERQGLSPPHWIKMDIEGMEYEALQGMEETLAAYHPTVYVEI